MNRFAKPDRQSLAVSGVTDRAPKRSLWGDFTRQIESPQNSQIQYCFSMREIRRSELILLWLIALVVFVTVIVHFENYAAKVDNFGDSSAYMAAASGIRKADFRDIHVKQFWGVSYVMAPVSFLCGGSVRASLLLVSAVSSLVAVLLAQQLWGGWIAAFFAIINFDWLQRSYLGGAEPLFMALLFATFLAARRGQWMLASALAAGATVTRPVGFFALITMGLVLLARKEYKKLAFSTGVALIIGALYVLPFWIYFGDPLYQVHSYKTNDWHSGPPIALPFYAIGGSFLHNRQPLTNVLLTLGWVLFVLIGLFFMARKSFRQYARERPSEAWFGFLYIAFIFTYNSSAWARADFVRFAIPALPFVLLALSDWIPRSRALLYGLSVLSAALAAGSAIGIKNVFHALH
jgi:hypothetical protein